MVLVGMGIDVYRAGDLGKDHGSAGSGERHLESRVPGEESWFWWRWG